MNATASIAAMAAAALSQASPPDLSTRQGGRDVFPAAFHGQWAPSLDACDTGQWVRFDTATFRGPDNLATLIRHVGVRQHRAPDGRPALTLLALAEFDSEGHVSRGRVRISRAGPFLYMSNPEEVGEREHWRLRNLRCPERRSR